TKFKKILKNTTYLLAVFFVLAAFYTIFLKPNGIAGFISPLQSQSALARRNPYEVFGFAPYWNLGKLDNVDFNTLTTLAYFGVPLNGDGTIDKDDIGYQKLETDQANALFQRAHSF